MFLTNISPIILIFFLGFFLKMIRLFGKETADIFLKFIFYVSLPALVFRSVHRVTLSTEYIFLPLIAVFVFFFLYFISLFIGKKLKLKRKTLGTFILAAMIMNTGFSLPFIFAAFGEEGVAIIAIFDFGNALFVLTFGYFIAMKFGNTKGSKVEFRKLLRIPPIWGLILGLIANFSKISIPQIADNFLNQLGILTIPLMMVSIGIYFAPRIQNLSRLMIVIFLRTGIGLLLGFFLTSVLNLEGMIKMIVIICCGAPVGYNTLIFSTLENLDKEFAANLVSISIFTGIVYIPVLILLV